MPTIEKIEVNEKHQLQFACQMTDVQSNRNDERLQIKVEINSKRIPQRSITSKRALLSFVAETNTDETVSRERCGVPKGTEDPTSTEHLDSPEVFESPTQT